MTSIAPDFADASTFVAQFEPASVVDAHHSFAIATNRNAELLTLDPRLLKEAKMLGI